MTGKIALLFILVAHFNVYAMRRICSDIKDREIKFETFSGSDLQKADALLLELDRLCSIINQYLHQQKTNDAIVKTPEGQIFFITIEQIGSTIEECRKVAETSAFLQYKKAKENYQENPTPDLQSVVTICAEELHKTIEYLMWLWKAKDKIKAYQPVRKVYDIQKAKNLLMSKLILHRKTTKAEECLNNLLLKYNAIENSPEYIQYENAKMDYAIAQLQDEPTSLFYEKELKTYKSNVKKTQQFREWEKALQHIEHIQVPEESFNKMVAAQTELYNTQEFKFYMDAYEIYKTNKTGRACITFFQDTYNKVTKTKQYQNLLLAQKEVDYLMDKAKRCNSLTNQIIGINYNPKDSEKRFCITDVLIV